MTNLMLKDTGVPARNLNLLRFTTMIKTLDSHLARSRHQRNKTVETQASFKECNRIPTIVRNSWTKNDVKRNRLSLALFQGLDGNILHVFTLVFDYCQLEWQTNLRCREANAGSIIHCVPHPFDQLLNVFTAHFFDTKLACP